MNSDTTISF